MGEIHAAEAFSALAAASLGGDNIEDAIAALMVLGYTQGEVVPLLAKLDPNLPSQELIKQTLRQIGAASNRR